MMLQLSEPKFRILDVYLKLALKKFFEPKETRSQIFIEFLYFYNKIFTDFCFEFFNF